MEISELILQTGEDIPFPEGQLIIHTPKIREISLLGEDTFFMGCSLLNFSKEKFLNEQDKINLNNKTDFDILMSILNDNRVNSISEMKNSAVMVLALLFPNYEIQFLEDEISFLDEENNNKGKIDNLNFNEFKKALSTILCIKTINKDSEYRPKGELARKIAEKLKKGKEKIAKQKGLQENISVFSRYISILSVGEGKDKNSLCNLSIYQLYDEFERYQLKLAYDLYIKKVLAGATPEKMEAPEDWMKDFHSEKAQQNK